MSAKPASLPRASLPSDLNVESPLSMASWIVLEYSGLRGIGSIKRRHLQKGRKNLADLRAPEGVSSVFRILGTVTEGHKKSSGYVDGNSGFPSDISLQSRGSRELDHLIDKSFYSGQILCWKQKCEEFNRSVNDCGWCGGRRDCQRIQNGASTDAQCIVFYGGDDRYSSLSVVE